MASISQCYSVSVLFAHLVLILCLGLSGCGGGGSSQGGTQNAPVLNLAGNWQASTISNLGVNTFLSGALAQTGSQVTGTMSISGSPCASSGTLSGTVNGSRVSMSLTEGAQSVSLNGTASQDGNSITGTYQAPSGGCTNGDSGTFSATRGLPVPPSALSYPSPVQATVGNAIAPLVPTVTGSVTSYSVSPPLPTGMSLNITNGVISGTPTASSVETTYVITASNVSGSTTFGLLLTVSPTVPPPPPNADINGSWEFVKSSHYTEDALIPVLDVSPRAKKS